LLTTHIKLLHLLIILFDFDFEFGNFSWN
jgi:hypothetical protein